MGLREKMGVNLSLSLSIFRLGSHAFGGWWRGVSDLTLTLSLSLSVTLFNRLIVGWCCS